MTAEITRVSDVVGDTARAHPDRIALQDADGARIVTYGELWRRVAGGAAALRDSGLRPGDRVLLALASGPDWMPCFLAIIHAGLVAVPIPAETPGDRAGLAALFTGARAWIGAAGNGEHAGALAHLPRLSPSELAAARSPWSDDEPIDARRTAVLVFTSGSTARPRAVALSHQNLRANLCAIASARQPAADEALLSTLPPSHAYELVAGQLAPLAAGARVVYGGPPLPNRLIDTMRRQRVTRAALVPALFEALVRDVLDWLADSGVVSTECRQLRATDLAERIRTLAFVRREQIRAAVRLRIGPALHTVVVGGAAMNPAWTDVLAAAGVDLDVGYGLTEAGPVVAMGRAADCPCGSVGRPLEGVRVRIGSGGEVLVQSDSIMQGYAGDSQATAAALDSGWLHTGDRGRVDSGGFLFITGRIKEAMVTSSGETVYPDEVEPYFVSPLFAEIAVVPAAGEDGNDWPALVVVPADSHMPVDVVRRAAASLNAAAPSRLRVSGVIVRSASLPRTAAGKIRRRELAQTITTAGVAS